MQKEFQQLEARFKEDSAALGGRPRETEQVLVSNYMRECCWGHGFSRLIGPCNRLPV
jgi:hypothetical protein